MRIEELTFFRFLAAAIVVVFHYGSDATGLTGALISGPEMVTFFFVLSGFVMGIAYLKKDIPIAGYLWARVSRIMPVYLLALALVVISHIMLNKEVDTVSLLLNLTLLQSWVSPHPLSLNSPGWSLSVEAFFYISFPLILYLIKKYSLSSVHIVISALTIWGVTHILTTVILTSGLYGGFPSYSHDKIFYFPLTHLCSFLFGISGAIWILERKQKAYNKELILLLFLVVFTAIVLILNSKSFIMNHLDLKLAFGSSLLAPLFIIFIVSITLCRSSIIRIFSIYPLVLLGEASYSLYILQKPVYQIYKKYFSETLALEAPTDFYVFFVFLTFISILTFLLFEKPANEFLRFSLPVFVNKQLTRASSGRAKSTRR
jgi:peptidoglycan/LPS O-acetylase OafA/YrhL